MPKTEAGPARRILLVEDHPVERAYLQNMLLALGCRRVAGVSSGAEALAALTRQSYDVLISDIAMGEGDGTRLPNELRRLMDSGRLKRMPPIIWISNLSDELRHSHVRLALQAGCPSAQALAAGVALGHAAGVETALHDIDDPDLSGRASAGPTRAELRRALGTGEGMSVVLQPQLNLTTGRMVSAEALSRWDHPTLGTIAAGDFVPAAHRLGLDRVLFERVAGQVLEVLRRMRGERIEVPIAINASAATLCSPDLPAQLEQLVARAGCRRGW